MARAYAGIVAPLIVLVVLLIHGASTPGYDPIRQTISELGSGWNGTRVISLYGFVLVLLVCQTFAKNLGTRISVAALISALVLVGLGCFGLGFVPAESGSWNSMSWQGRLHLIFAFGFIFAGIPAVYLSAARALPATWRGVRAYSLFSGLASAALLAGTLAALGASPPNRYVVSHLGLIERAYVFSFLAWQCTVSLELLRGTYPFSTGFPQVGDRSRRR